MKIDSVEIENMSIDQLKDQLEKLVINIEEIQEKIECFEANPSDYEDEFDNMLDESPIEILGMSYNPSRILYEVDPIAYRCCLADYVDSLDIEDDKAYIELTGTFEEIDNLIEEIKERIEEIEEEGNND